MSLALLALVLAAGLAGPALAWPKRLGVPVVVGQVLVGVLLGRTGLRLLDPAQPGFAFLAEAGFALVMLVAGAHVPLRDPALRPALRRGMTLAALSGACAVPAAYLAAHVGGVPHQLPLFAVLMASSSAGLVLPVLADTRLAGPRVLVLVVQVAVADITCIVALPLAADPARAAHAAAAGGALLGAGVLLLLVLRQLSMRGVLRRIGRVSQARHFGVQLRLSLAILFGLAGLAQALGSSVMLAGFTGGLLLAALGQPRRLAGQLFAVTDGFLAPVFFVWFGADLDLRQLAGHPRMLLLAAVLAVGAIAAHLVAGVGGQGSALALLSSAQMGVPIAAVTIMGRRHLLAPGEAGAIVAAALVTVGVTGLAAVRARRSLAAAHPDPAPAPGGLAGSSGAAAGVTA